MNPLSKIILFTGPSAAGKSTIAEAWASSQSTRTAFFDHDHARFLIRSGYISRTAARADPSLQPEADQQWLLAAAVCESMAQTYHEWGANFAIAAFRPPGRWMGCWERLDMLSPLIIVLLPSVETLVLRDAERTGRSHVGADNVRRNYATYDWAAWRNDPRAFVIDNTDMSMDRVLAQVEIAIGKHYA